VKFHLALLAGFILFFTGAWGAAAESSPMSDREQKGLRGPVKTCVEETTYPDVTAPDGTQVPERKSSYTTEYDVTGHIVWVRFGNTGGSEWVSRYSYGASGQLLKITSGNEGEQSRETVYSYDDSGRPLKIIDGYTPDNPVTFRYDEQGKKTKLQISRPEDYRPDLAVAGSPFQAADMAPNLPGGGTATTLYDERDQPTEVQVRDARDQLVGRTMRIYDSQGRVTEEKQILDKPELLFPEEFWAKMFEASGTPPEEVRAELTQQLSRLMGGDAGPSSIAYTYDEQGRVKQIRRRIFNEEGIIETTYNEQGDTATEITRRVRVNNEKELAGPAPAMFSFSEVRHSYQYDDRGNWTEQITSHRFTPDGPFGSSSILRRTLTYY
jgi:hypothetical protein